IISIHTPASIHSLTCIHSHFTFNHQHHIHRAATGMGGKQKWGGRGGRRNHHDNLPPLSSASTPPLLFRLGGRSEHGRGSGRGSGVRRECALVAAAVVLVFGC